MIGRAVGNTLYSSEISRDRRPGGETLSDTLTGRVLELVASGQATSRTELAHQLGAAASSVSMAVAQLIAHGLLADAGVQSTAYGRPRKTLRIGRADEYALAAELGSRHARIGIVRTGGDPRGRDDDPARRRRGSGRCARRSRRRVAPAHRRGAGKSARRRAGTARTGRLGGRRCRQPVAHAGLARLPGARAPRDEVRCPRRRRQRRQPDGHRRDRRAPGRSPALRYGQGGHRNRRGHHDRRAPVSRCDGRGGRHQPRPRRRGG